jgi:hypothetical protein
MAPPPERDSAPVPRHRCPHGYRMGTADHDLTIRTAVSGWNRRVGRQEGSFGDNRAIVIHGTHY